MIRRFHLRTTLEKGIMSQPILLHIRKHCPYCLSSGCITELVLEVSSSSPE